MTLCSVGWTGAAAATGNLPEPEGVKISSFLCVLDPRCRHKQRLATRPIPRRNGARVNHPGSREFVSDRSAHIGREAAMIRHPCSVHYVRYGEVNMTDPNMPDGGKELNLNVPKSFQLDVYVWHEREDGSKLRKTMDNTEY